MSNELYEVNEDAIEPVEYFKILKDKKKIQNEDALKAQLNTLAENILAAKQIGQTRFLEQLSFTYDAIIKEQMLLAAGYDTFVYRDDIRYFLDNVQPANSIKIIELDRYPRSIPLDILEELSKIKEMEIFDEFLVVFTDFSDNDYKTAEEEEFVNRNRDPIIFGMFSQKETGLKHDRFYFLADWEDEFCHLKFSTMIEQMAEMGFDDVEKTINYDSDYLNEIVNNTLATMKEHNSKKTIVALQEQNKEDNKGFFQRLFSRKK